MVLIPTAVKMESMLGLWEFPAFIFIQKRQRTGMEGETVLRLIESLTSV